MATIDIGKLTFTHKGDYAGGTAYVANDVVYYNGSAYIAKTSTTGNLPTSTAHWNTFAAGSGGIWSGSLSLGSATQQLRENSGASALEFFTPATATSDFVRIVSGSISGTELIIDNCFTTTYELYEVHFYNIRMSSYHRMQWRTGGSSGSTETGSHYRYLTKYFFRTSGSASDTGENNWADSSFRMAYDGSGAGTDYGHHHVLQIAEPTRASRTNFVGLRNQVTSGSTGYSASGGYYNSNDVVTGLRLYSNSGSSFTADYAIYGKKIS